MINLENACKHPAPLRVALSKALEQASIILETSQHGGRAYAWDSAASLALAPRVSNPVLLPKIPTLQTTGSREIQLDQRTCVGPSWLVFITLLFWSHVF